jgi:hypothetical protein
MKMNSIISEKELLQLKDVIKNISLKDNDVLELEFRVNGGNVISIMEFIQLEKCQHYSVTCFLNTNIRLITKNEEKTYQEKVKNNISLADYDVTVGVSVETPIKKGEKSSNLIEMVTRSINRYSFKIDNLYETDLWLDISEVQQFNHLSENLKNLVEIEIDYSVTNKNFKKIHDNWDDIFCKIQYHLERYLKVIYDTPFLISNKRENQLVAEVTKIMEKNIWLCKNQNRKDFNFNTNAFEKLMNNSLRKESMNLDAKYFLKPVDLHLFHMLFKENDCGITDPSGFSVMYKTDGLRGTIYFSTDGVYTFGSKRTFKKISNKIYTSLIGLILEVEFLLPNGRFVELEGLFLQQQQQQQNNIIKCFVFDVMAYPKVIEREKQDKISYHKYLDRWNTAKSLVESVEKLENIQICWKNFLVFSGMKEFYTIMNQMLSEKEYNNQDFQVEGLVFTPLIMSSNIFELESSTKIYKWKPLLTVDVLPQYIQGKCVAMVTDKQYVIPYKINGTLVEIKNTPPLFIKYNMICEYKYIHDKDGVGYLDYIRCRFDKCKPNNINTINNIFKLIAKPLTLQTLCGKTLDLMKLYHNKIKLFHLIDAVKRNTYQGEKNLCLIDIGSGQGGDVLKWKHLLSFKIPFQFIAVEKKENISELNKRIQEHNLDVLIIHEDFASEKTLKDLTLMEKKANIISLFHVFSLVWSSNDYIERFLNNLLYICQKNTILKIITFDAQRFLLDKKILVGQKYTSNLITIKYLNSNEIFIKLANSESVNQEGQVEYIVNFESLFSKLKNLGFQIIQDYYIVSNGFLNFDMIDYSTYNRVITVIKS